MNNWDNVRLGSELTPFRDGRYKCQDDRDRSRWAPIYRAEFTPRAATASASGQLVLRDFVGKAQVYIDGKQLAEKAGPEKKDLTVAFPSGAGQES